LQRAREVAEEASRMKSQFLGNVSHELRTPLNAVINFARLMADQIHGPLGAPQYTDYTQDILESGTHLLGLIDELLDLARAEAGRLSIAESVVDIQRLIATVCRALRPEAAAKGLVLADAVPQDLSNLRGDPTRIRQVLLNLVANAIKFTASGGCVTVGVEHAPGDDLRITVSDNGIGIANQDLQRVMEPFVQVPLPSGMSHPGVGLGLPLSRHLIDLHGGTLTLHSTADAGTTAIVTLPASRVLLAEPHTAPRNAFT
jgi:signal transduction histidine kinase